MLYVVGPGHGAPALLASLWLEGSLGKFYPEYAKDKEGLHNLISTFSTSAGLPRLVCIYASSQLKSQANSFGKPHQC